MNDYRITYTTEAGESFTSSLITERTEAAARKYFNAMNKGLGFTVSGIELVRENTCATKQQERDTLEAIKKMVAELGPQSYLATAFEGCFQDAEDNIDDDAAYSMKGRLESAEKKLDEAAETIERLKADIGLLTSALENERAAVKAIEQRVLSADDLATASQLLAGKVVDLTAEVNNAAERIVEAAGDPGSAAFQNAVKDHRAAKADLDRFTALLERVSTIRKAGA